MDAQAHTRNKKLELDTFCVEEWMESMHKGKNFFNKKHQLSIISILLK